MNFKNGEKSVETRKSSKLVVICHALYRGDLLTGVRLKRVEF